MTRASTHSRLERLELLASRLKADEPMTSGELAAEFGVGIRTLARDIALLRDRGLPVEAERGRGGGVRLDRHWGVGRLSLTYREAVDLLVSLAIAEQLGSPWMIANLSAIRRKLSASFAPALKQKIAELRSRILIGKAASPGVLGSVPKVTYANGDLLTAFVEMSMVDLTYIDVEGRRSQRRIEPHLLLLNYPVWYVIAWDQSRAAVRSFRCDRIERAELGVETFRRRAASVFDAAIEGIDAIRP